MPPAHTFVNKPTDYARYLKKPTATLSHWGQASSRKQSECGMPGLSNIVKLQEKNRPTQEVQHLISSFWAGPRRIWDQKLIFYGPISMIRPFSLVNNSHITLYPQLEIIWKVSKSLRKYWGKYGQISFYIISCITRDCIIVENIFLV